MFEKGLERAGAAPSRDFGGDEADLSRFGRELCRLGGRAAKGPGVLLAKGFGEWKLRRGQLMPHQMKGLRWMARPGKAFEVFFSTSYQILSFIFFISRLVDNEMSGILADDMGLGKTVQTLALLAFLAEHRQQTGLVQDVTCRSILPEVLGG